MPFFSAVCVSADSNQSLCILESADCLTMGITNRTICSFVLSQKTVSLKLKVEARERNRDKQRAAIRMQVYGLFPGESDSIMLMQLLPVLLVSIVALVWPP